MVNTTKSEICVCSENYTFKVQTNKEHNSDEFIPDSSRLSHVSVQPLLGVDTSVGFDSQPLLFPQAELSHPAPASPGFVFETDACFGCVGLVVGLFSTAGGANDDTLDCGADVDFGCV